MSWALPAASVLNEILDLIGIVLGSTGVGSGLGITIAVLRQQDLAEIEQLGFQGTAVGFLIGTLASIGVLVVAS